MKAIYLVMAVLAVSLCHFQTLAQNSSVGGNDLITKACSTTPYNNLCKTILESSPRSNGADLYGLAQIAMATAAQNVSNIYEILDQLQNDTTVDSFIDQCVTDCLENYQDAIDQIEDSVTALEFKAYNDVKTWVLAAMSDAATCDMGFKEKPGYQSPIAQMSTVFDQTCSIILAIVKQITEGNRSDNSS